MNLIEFAELYNRSRKRMLLNLNNTLKSAAKNVKKMKYKTLLRIFLHFNTL